MSQSLHLRARTGRLAVLACTLLGPAVALAHPGHAGHGDFLSGLRHPLTGLDHLSALFALGLWAEWLGGSLRRTLPLAVLSAMAIGALAAGALPVPAGSAGPALDVAALDQWLAASLLLLGLLTAYLARLPRAATLPLASAFALFHGVAHGAELPADGARLTWMAGMLAGSLLLLIAGSLITRWLQWRDPRPVRQRQLGGLVAAVGFALLLGG